MTKKTPRLPNLLESLFIMAGFIALMFVSLVTFAEAQIPIQLPLFGSWFLVMGLGLFLGHDYRSFQKGIHKGISKGLDALLILLVVGALIGSWIAGGIVPSIIYYGLKVINPHFFLLTAFVLCAVTSLATGTSFGTVGTAGVAMMGIGAGFGLPAPLVAGAAISGAYVGDKLSPLSDTTVMTASISGVDLVDHIKSMLLISAPAALVAGIFFIIAGFIGAGESADVSNVAVILKDMESAFNLGWYLLTPCVIVIGLLAFRMPSVPVITLGAVMGIFCAWIFQDMSFLNALKTTYAGNQITNPEASEFITRLLNRGGIQSMLGVIALIIFALGLGGLMQQVGILKTISNTLLKWADSIPKLTASTLLSGFFGNFFGGAAYVSLITATTMTEENYDKMGIDRRVLSRNVEAGGTVTTPMVPWSDGGVFMATTLGVSTVQYLPYLWYPFLVLIFAMVLPIVGIGNWKAKAVPPYQEESTTEN